MPTLEVILLALVYESTVAGINSDMIWQEFSWPMGFDIKVKMAHETIHMPP